MVGMAKRKVWSWWRLMRVEEMVWWWWWKLR
jgi:hypothetical protein